MFYILRLPNCCLNFFGREFCVDNVHLCRLTLHYERSNLHPCWPGYVFPHTLVVPRDEITTTVWELLLVIWNQLIIWGFCWNIVSLYPCLLELQAIPHRVHLSSRNPGRKCVLGTLLVCRMSLRVWVNCTGTFIISPKIWRPIDLCYFLKMLLRKVV